LKQNDKLLHKNYKVPRTYSRVVDPAQAVVMPVQANNAKYCSQ